MLKFRTEGFCGCSVAYSPFLDNRLAVGASANFGLVGNGRVYVLDISPDARINAVRTFDTQDSVMCVAWSESHSNQVAAAGGDGRVRLFDVSTHEPYPLQAFSEHSREVFSVQWGLVDKALFCTGSWDGTIKIWDPARTQSLLTLHSKDGLALCPTPPSQGIPPDVQPVYSAKFSPHDPTSILSAHADGFARVWDTRSAVQKLAIPAVRGGDCLTVDWNKYSPHVVATAGVDKIVRVWDTRNLTAPVNDFRGHQFPVKSVKWSPHSREYLLSTSYDMTARVWRDIPGPHVPHVGPRGLVKDFTAHTEFVIDGDWSLWGEPGWAATVGWDQMLYLWKGY